MTEIDYDSLSKPELLSIQAKVNKALATYEERRKRETLAEIERLARERGFTLAEITGVAAPARGRRKAKAAPAPGHYVNPDNPSQTWPGVGRRPRWFIEALAAGRDPESMRV